MKTLRQRLAPRAAAAMLLAALFGSLAPAYAQTTIGPQTPTGTPGAPNAKTLSVQGCSATATPTCTPVNTAADSVADAPTPIALTGGSAAGERHDQRLRRPEARLPAIRERGAGDGRQPPGDSGATEGGAERPSLPDCRSKHFNPNRNLP